MPKEPDGWWRDAERLAEAIEQKGVAGAARAAGVDHSTITKWARKLGVPLPAPGRKAAELVGGEVDEAEILRRRVKELEHRLTLVRNEEVVEERLARRLEEALPLSVPRYQPPDPKLFTAEREAQELVLLLSDLHAAEVVSAEETEGLNSYDWPTMLQRLQRVQTAVISHKEHAGYPVRTLHVHMLGDMLSGDIHEELVETNDRPLVEACSDLAAELARFLEEFVPYFERIVVAGVPGNHPRLRRKPPAKLAHNNVDWLCYQMVRLHLKAQPSITFQLKRGAFLDVMIAGRWRSLLMHGDGIRSGFPGVPWGGVARRITTLQAQFHQAKRPFDYVEMGHWHTANVLSGVGVETFINGSVKGPDEYALKQFGQGQPACQRLLSFHPRWGVTAAFWIDLQEVQPAAVGWPIAA